ncbi:flagellar basal body rod protein FlgB [Aliifodinibius salicampi]|uniref:Flagellar basal body rod protein FlgB n=1 Tax=Fodinibius salicampi TaxID=1920655 RepID=A0ABT3Q0Q9_9BACT|nr:flagellar basal body rod protein FlgB [Fodinibius salicampi]MCW9713626.1 flagellar basal body rod protein FlgB [Fodinibius salicampi]
MELIDSSHSQLLAKAMDSYTLRQRVTSSNIANIDTPGYKRHEVQFENELQKVRDKGGAKDMEKVNPSIKETGGDVVLEDELIEMADTQMRVQLVTRSLRHHFNMLRTGITSTNR